MESGLQILFLQSKELNNSSEIGSEYGNNFMKNFDGTVLHAGWKIFLLLWLPTISFAMPVLKHVQVKNATEFYLVFDGKVDDAQISSEFVNDIFQVNLKNVAVYPAKIIPIQGKFFSKIFAYQYSPKVVRCRFTLKGKVAEFKRKIRITSRGETVTVKLEQPFPLAKEQRVAPVSEQARLAEAEGAADALDEQALLQKVIRGTDPAQAVKETEGHEASVAHADTPSEIHGKAAEGFSKTPSALSEEVHGTEDNKPRLTSGKALPAIWPVVAKLGFVILLVCLLAALAKKLKTTPMGRTWLQAAGKLAKKSLSKNRDMIQVISTHHLDPKKSLAVVKVAGRLLVLGVSNDAINLITQIPSDGADGGVLDFGSDMALTSASLAEDPIFADFLGKEKMKPGPKLDRDQSPHGVGSEQFRSKQQPRQSEAFEQPEQTTDSLSFVPSARSRIKNRLEGLKQL